MPVKVALNIGLQLKHERNLNFAIIRSRDLCDMSSGSMLKLCFFLNLPSGSGTGITWNFHLPSSRYDGIITVNLKVAGDPALSTNDKD